MPLHFGKIFGAIALLTVAAFVLWLLLTTFFATEEADQKIEGRGDWRQPQLGHRLAGIGQVSNEMDSVSVLIPLRRPSTMAQANSQNKW